MFGFTNVGFGTIGWAGRQGDGGENEGSGEATGSEEDGIVGLDLGAGERTGETVATVTSGLRLSSGDVFLGGLTLVSLTPAR